MAIPTIILRDGYSSVCIDCEVIIKPITQTSIPDELIIIGVGIGIIFMCTLIIVISVAKIGVMKNE